MGSLPSRSIEYGSLFGIRSLRHQLRNSYRSSITRLASNTILPPPSASTSGTLYSRQHHGFNYPDPPIRLDSISPDKQYERDIHFHGNVTVAFSKDLQAAEQRYFLNLPNAHRKILGLDNKPSWTPYTRYNTCFEVILALSNMKPSVLFWAETGGGDASLVYNDYVEAVLLPLFNKSGLQKYGYILQKIPHEVVVNGVENWGGAWVLADTRSTQWDVVRNVYFNAENTQHKSPITGRALGLPILPSFSHYSMRFTLINATATRKLSERMGEKVTPVVAGDYLGSHEQMQIKYSKEHFLRCQAIAALHGIELELECFPWR